MPVPIPIVLLIIWALGYLFPKIDETYNDGKAIKKLEKELEDLLGKAAKRSDDPEKMIAACEKYLKQKHPDVYKAQKKTIKRTLSKVATAARDPKFANKKPSKSAAKKLTA